MLSLCKIMGGSDLCLLAAGAECCSEGARHARDKAGRFLDL